MNLFVLIADILSNTLITYKNCKESTSIFTRARTSPDKCQTNYSMHFWTMLENVINLNSVELVKFFLLLIYINIIILFYGIFTTTI